MAERKLLRLRRDDACATCAQPVVAGTHAYWLKEERVVICQGCGDKPASPEPPEPPPESVAGASARAIYEQKRDAREQRARQRYGRIGGWAAKVSSGPQHERAWANGAEGEAENARRLKKLLADTPVVLLHDRRLPGKRANIDHIAVGPGGVTVIDSKKLAGKVRVDWRGGLFSERTFDLYVSGRRRTNLVDSVERQVAAVRDVLAGAGLPDVPVAGALCMADPEGLPLFKRLKIRDVAIDRTRRIAELAARQGDLDAEALKRVTSILTDRLPPAGESGSPVPARQT